jgi:TRAP-type transport system periplasmic protein
MKSARTFPLLAAFAIAAGSAMPAEAAPKHKVRWLLGHPNLDYFEEAARSFKLAVENGSRGEIEVEIVTAPSAPGSVTALAQPESELAAAVAAGRAEMGHSFTDVIGGLDARYWAFEAPYLLRDSHHAEGVLEGAVGRDMLAGLSAKGLVGLSFTYSGGPCGVATLGREIRRPEDLKGLKVGVYGDPVNRAWLEAVGAEPVAVAHDVENLADKVGRGSIDAVVITWRNLQRSNLPHAFNRVNLMGSTYLVSATYANAAFWASLPREHRELLAREARKAGAIERAKTLELNETARRQMTAKGVREVVLSPAARKAFIAAVQPAYAGALDPLLGRAFLERIRRAGDRAHPSIPDELARAWPVGP